MENTVERLKERIDIVELIGATVKLKRAGRNFKGLCPFHQEKTPSFIVSPDRQLWRCFGSCGTGGDAIAFFMKYENVTFPEALTELANKYGIPLDIGHTSDSQTQQKDRLIALHKKAAEYYHYILTQSSIGKKALDYLKERGITDKIITTFQLGYAPSSWDSFCRFAHSKSFNDHDLVDGGLAIQKNGGTVYDRFRGRVMFPLANQRGVVVGFSGRIMGGGNEAKYINTPETVLYHKRSMLYGLHLVKEAIKKENHVIVVEGEFDMITPYQKGVNTVVAIKGSALTTEQLQLIKRYTTKLSLALDTDAAGEEAIRRAIEVAEPLGFELGVIVIEGGKDPDEAMRNNEVLCKQSLKKIIPVYDFLMHLFLKKYPPTDPFSKKHIGDEMAPFLHNITNPIVQSYYMKQLAHVLDVSEDSIYKVVRSYRQKRYRKPPIDTSPTATKPMVSREMRLEQYLLGQLLQSDNPKLLTTPIHPPLCANDFSIPTYGNLYSALMSTGASFDINTFAQTLSPPLRAVADELYLQASSDRSDSTASLTAVTTQIRANALKKRIKLLLEETTDAHDAEIVTIQAQLKELEKTTTSE